VLNHGQLFCWIGRAADERERLSVIFPVSV
jgi:hypothetical protein